jgi:hypothetical protein
MFNQFSELFILSWSYLPETFQVGRCAAIPKTVYTSPVFKLMPTVFIPIQPMRTFWTEVPHLRGSFVKLTPAFIAGSGALVYLLPHNLKMCPLPIFSRQKTENRKQETLNL